MSQLGKKIIGVIPARYKSSRLPGKPLVELLGKPMIIWVLELTAAVLGKENTYVATDDQRIFELVNNSGFQAIMTSEDHKTGTDRLVEVANLIEADFYVNIQGDEPTLNPASIQKVIEAKIKHPDKVINAMTEISNNENPNSKNIPKVVFSESNEMIYMSRLPLPGYKDPENKPKFYFKQVCIYAFSRSQLLAFGNLNRKSKVESFEDIEILRFIDLSVPVKMVKVEGNTYAVDVKEDIPIVENRLKEIHGVI